MSRADRSLASAAKAFELERGRGLTRGELAFDRSFHLLPIAASEGRHCGHLRLHPRDRLSSALPPGLSSQAPIRLPESRATPSLQASRTSRCNAVAFDRMPDRQELVRIAAPNITVQNKSASWLWRPFQVNAICPKAAT